jgi:hypothetical protein
VPGKAVLEDLYGNMRTVAVDSADRVVAVGKAARAPTDRSEVIAAEEFAGPLVISVPPNKKLLCEAPSLAAERSLSAGASAPITA